MLRTLALSLLLTSAVCSTASAAPIKLEFWHAMEGVQGKVAQYAQEFNRSQNVYEVVPVSKGNYRELLPALQKAVQGGNAPALAQLEFTQIAPLVAAGQLTDLSKADDAVKGEVLKDFYTPAWKAGEFAGKRYALPWNLSVPVLMYNAGTLKRAGIAAPTTWAELESASRRLASGGKRPLIAAADAWTFEANVLSRGGSLVKGNEPSLNSPEAIAALTQLARMSQAGQAQPRTLSEATRAAFDFARGQNTFVLASVANWTDARKVPFFQLGIAPFPCETAGANCAVPLGGGAIVVPKGASAQQQAGAIAFWQFLMEPARLADWVKTTAYAPPRRSVTPLLTPWYNQNPQLRVAHAQMERATPRPANASYSAWIPLIENAYTRAVTGKASAQAALNEAQQEAQK